MRAALENAWHDRTKGPTRQRAAAPVRHALRVPEVTHVLQKYPAESVREWPRVSLEMVRALPKQPAESESCRFAGYVLLMGVQILPDAFP